MVKQSFCDWDLFRRIRRLWDSHKRCTANLIGSVTILSADMPHGGYDEGNYIAELENVKVGHHG